MAYVGRPLGGPLVLEWNPVVGHLGGRAVDDCDSGGWDPPSARSQTRPYGRRLRNACSGARRHIVPASGLVQSSDPKRRRRRRVEAPSKRFTSLPDVLGNPSSDQSYNLRASQWRIAWRTFTSNPAAGVGPGHRFTWPYPYVPSGTSSGYNLDTPVAFPAKFGIVGLAVIVAGLGACVVFLRRLWSPGRPTVEQLAFAGFAAIVVASVPLGTVFEEKGFSFGLLFLLVAIVQAESARELEPLTI